MKTIVKNFGSLSEILDFVSTAEVKWKNELSSQKIGEIDWYGTETFDEAVLLGKYGWPKGRKYLSDKLLENNILPSQKISENYSYDVAGAFPDVPRFLGGDPFCMVNFSDEIKSSKKILSIKFESGSPCFVSGEKKINFGAALVSWIDYLEIQGYRTDIEFVSYITPSRKEGPDVFHSLSLKHADEPVDIDKLAYWLINPAAQRRIGFAFLERLDVERYYTPNYGYSYSVHKKKDAYDSEDLLLVCGNGASSVDEGIVTLKSQLEAYLETTFDL